MQLHIPKPCHEDWNGMTPDGNGRFCGSCSKIVVDFTAMSDAEVQNYLLNRSQEKLCGRFTRTQLKRITIEVPATTLSLRLPVWKRFLVASLLAFSTLLFSCDATVKEEQVVGALTNTPIKLTNIDTAISSHDTQQWAMHDSLPEPKNCTVTIGETFITGAIAPPPPDVLMGTPLIEPLPTPEPIIGKILPDSIPEPKILMGEPAVIPADTLHKKPGKQDKKPNCSDTTVVSAP